MTQKLTLSDDEFAPPKRETFDTVPEWANARADWFKALKHRVRTKPEPEVIEKIVKIPVEKIVYRDPLSDKLAALEAAKARIDDRSEPEAEPEERLEGGQYKTSFLEEERLNPDETLEGIEARLLAELENLEARRPLGLVDSARHKRLWDAYYDFKG